MRASALAKLVLIGGACAAVTAVLGKPAAVVAAGTAYAWQEISLEGQGIGPQTIAGSHGVAESFFPPPAAPLATSGSFVRVFFSHTPQLTTGSSMLIAVNDQPRTTVALSAATAAGDVLEVSVPASLIETERPNRLQVTFDLAGVGATGGELYGRVESRTLIHYNLAVRGQGTPGLETYPYSLLATNAASPAMPTLGVVLPSPPETTEAAAALRILADLGRRAAAQRVRVTVMTPSDLPDPGTEGAGLLLVGRLDHLPAAIRLLAAAGWRSTAAGWVAPDGGVATPRDGLLVTAISPWDGRTPVILVTGRTDHALAEAASTLIQAGPIPLAGEYAIVPPTTAAQPAGAPSRRLDLEGPSLLELGALSPGSYRSDLGFIAPAVAPAAPVELDLTLPALGGSGPASLARITVNGNLVATRALNESGQQATSLRAIFAGHVLRPGRNSLTLALQLQPGGPVGAPPLAGGANAVTATLQLPPAPREGSDLASLPYPFLDDPRTRARVVVPDLTEESLTAAAEAMLALGHRAAGSPNTVEAVLAGDPAVMSGDAGLIVLGDPAMRGSLAPVARGLPLHVSASGVVSIAGAQQTPELLSPSLAAVQEITAEGHPVLWLGGTGAAGLGRAAGALYASNLSGQLAVVDTTGRVSVVIPAHQGPEADSSAGSPGTATVVVGLLILTMAVVLLGIAVWQLLRSGRLAR